MRSLYSRTEWKSSWCLTCLSCPMCPKEARGSPVIATSVHPGIVNTNLIRYIAPEKVMQARQKDLEGSLRIGKMLGEAALGHFCGWAEEERDGGGRERLDDLALTNRRLALWQGS